MEHIQRIIKINKNAKIIRDTYITQDKDNIRIAIDQYSTLPKIMVRHKNNISKKCIRRKPYIRKNQWHIRYRNGNECVLGYVVDRHIVNKKETTMFYILI